MAWARVSVWVSDTSHDDPPRWRASSAAAPVTESEGASAARPLHLDVVPGEGAEADAERLHHRLLRGEAHGVARSRSRAEGETASQ